MYIYPEIYSCEKETNLDLQMNWTNVGREFLGCSSIGRRNPIGVGSLIKLRRKKLEWREAKAAKIFMKNYWKGGHRVPKIWRGCSRVLFCMCFGRKYSRPKKGLLQSSRLKNSWSSNGAKNNLCFHQKGERTLIAHRTLDRILRKVSSL